MSAHTYYVALPFDRCAEGHLIPRAARECSSAEDACVEAESFGRSHVGAVAFSRVLDKNVGRVARASILRQFGEVPKLDYLLGR